MFNTSLLSRYMAIQLTSALFLMFTAYTGMAQDPHFSQFYANPTYLNPALTGTNGCPRLTMNFRDQWPGISGVYVTYGAAYDTHVNGLGGLGLSVMNDNQASGTLRRTMVSGSYAWQQPLNPKLSFSMGAKVSYRNSYLDFSKLSFGDQIDGQKGFIKPTAEHNNFINSNIIDFSAGMLLYSKEFYAGFAVDHIAEPLEGFASNPISRLYRRYTIHAGATLKPKSQSGQSNEVSISPNLLYMRQGKSEELNVGLYVRKSVLVAGMWLRKKDAFIVLLGIETKHYKMGYSYDFTVSRLTNETAGGHEVSLQYLFACRKRKPRFRVPDCPSF